MCKYICTCIARNLMKVWTGFYVRFIFSLYLCYNSLRSGLPHSTSNYSNKCYYRPSLDYFSLFYVRTKLERNIWLAGRCGYGPAEMSTLYIEPNSVIRVI